MSQLPPVIPQPKNVFHRLAQFCWASIILSFFVNLFPMGVSGSTGARESNFMASLTLLALVAGGIISGIVALCAIPRHGRKGLLVPSLVGLTIWALLFAMATPAILAVRARAHSTKLSPAIHSPKATRHTDEKLDFSFDVPEGYAVWLEGRSFKGVTHAYLREVPGQVNRILLVRPLGGTLGRERMKNSEIPAGTLATLSPFNWRGLEIDGFRVPEQAEGVSYVNFNIQIPLRKSAVQITFTGPLAQEAELRQTATQLLSSLEGKTNW